MSAILDTIIARGFNLNQPEFGRNMIEAQNRRQIVDNGLKNGELYRQAQQFDLNQAQQAATDQQAVGQMLPELMNLPQEAMQGAEQRLANFDAAAAQGKVDSALRPRAMEMLQGGLESIPARQQQVLAKMAEKDPAIRELMLKSYLTPPEAPKQSDIAELIAERDALAQRDPNSPYLQYYAQALQKETTHSPFNGFAPQYTTAQILGPDGQPQLVSFPQGDPSQMAVIGNVPNAATKLSASERELARSKLEQVRLARQQLANINEKFSAIKDSYSAGPVQGLLPTPEGKAFDASVDAVRQTFLALTRVPGVGSQNQNEFAVTQAPLPSRSNYEDVTQQQIDQLDQMLNTIESGYTEMTSEANGVQSPQQSGNVAPEGTVIESNGQQLVKRGGQWVPVQ